MVAQPQEKLHKRYENTTERFRNAYFKGIPAGLQSEARKAFCSVHNIREGTFRKRLCGVMPITERECEWMEKYDPYNS